MFAVVVGSDTMVFNYVNTSAADDDDDSKKGSNDNDVVWIQ